MFRLRVAGRSDPLINDDAFEVLYERSQGIPREIIRLCALAIDNLLQSEESVINVDVAREVSNV
jgi:type II secretory pathway predicted ATPase ExeA